jgi:hypothetical protein
MYYLAFKNGYKIVGMLFLLFSSIRIGREFGDLTIVWMESSQNKHKLETVDESCFLLNLETRNLPNQYLYFCISEIAVTNIKLLCEY